VKKRIILLIFLAVQLNGCGHAIWSSLRDKTELAAFTPSGFILNMAGRIGVMVSESQPHFDQMDYQESETKY
jgi:hypothetical protein